MKIKANESFNQMYDSQMGVYEQGKVYELDDDHAKWLSAIVGNKIELNPVEVEIKEEVKKEPVVKAKPIARKRTK